MKYELAVVTGMSILAASILASDKEIGLNGSFEEIKSETDGNLMPENWIKDKSSPGGDVKIVWEEGDVKNGKFALNVETDTGKSIHVYNYNAPIKTQAEDVFTIEVSVKGKGKFGIFFYNYAGDNAFLGTTAAKNEKNEHSLSISSDNWLDMKFEFKIISLKQQVPAFIKVCIVVEADSKIYFDDLKIDRVIKKN